MTKRKKDLITAARSATMEATDELIAEVNKYLTEQAIASVSLKGAEMLTGLTGDSYRKEAHVGGETFIPTSIRFGEKKLIASFKPTHVARYSHIEMSVDDAIDKMLGFADLMQDSVSGGWVGRVKKVSEMAADANEAKKSVEKFNTYDSFGTF